MVKASPISVRLEQETRAGLERAARADKRTLNSMIEKALSDWLTEKGFAEEPEPPKSAPARGRKSKTLAAALAMPADTP
jgi:hypothetical protein